MSALAMTAMLAFAPLPASAKSLEATRQQAYDLEERGDCTRAYPLFVEAARQSGNASDYAAAGYCAAQLKRHQDAIANFQAALSAQPGLSIKDRAEVMAGLADAFESKKNWSEAAKAWAGAHALTGKDVYLLGQARSLKMAGDRARALSAYERLNPAALNRAQQAEYWSDKAELLAEVDPARALDAIDRAIALGDTAERRMARGDILLKLGRKGEALTELELAHRRAPDNADTALSLAYGYNEAGRYDEAAAMFDKAARLNSKSAAPLEDWGYALMAAGRREEAAEKFRRAIDLALAEQPATPEATLTRDRRVWDMRRQLHDMERDFFFSADFTYRQDSGVSALALPDARRLQSGFGFQTGWNTPLGLFGERNIAIYGGAYFTFLDDELTLDRDSPQATVGLRWQPFSEQAMFVSIERLIGLGDSARDAWLASVSFSGGEGTEWNPAAPSWTYVALETSASYLWEAPKYLGVAAELRAGRAIALADQFAIVPHVLLSGDYQEDGAAQSSLIETGAGLSMMAWFCNDRYEGPLCSTQLTAQYRYVLAQEGLDRERTSVVAQVSFGF